MSRVIKSMETESQLAVGRDGKGRMSSDCRVGMMLPFGMVKILWNYVVVMAVHFISVNEVEE